MNEQTVQIPLSRGVFATIDNADAESISSYKWHCTKAGYAARSIERGRCVYMHRAIANVPQGMETDHINGDKLDNRRNNLRVCTHAQNGKNLKLSKANKTGFKGVDKHSQNGNYRSQIMADGKMKHLGCFPTPELAGAAYAAACVQFHGEFANPAVK